MKLTRIQKPRGYKEERASFPDQFYTRVSKIHIPKILTLERKEGRGRRRRRQGERGQLLLDARRRARERVGEGIFMPTNSRTKRLNYP